MRYLNCKNGKASKKDRRHSGRKVEGIYPDTWESYNEWDNYRDGMRGYPDHKKIQSEYSWLSEYAEVPKYNKKNKKLLEIRKAMKSGRTSCVI